jgi:acetylornithine deacetylase
MVSRAGGAKSRSTRPEPDRQSSTAEAAREARRLLRPLKRELIWLLQRLVRTNSVAVPPDGNEAAAQKLLYRFLKAHKLDVEIYDTGFLNRSRHRYVRRERRYAGRPNVIARLSGRGRGRSLLLTGHVDTVPPGPDPWKLSPWSGAIRNGRLYGRGSWDMKGGLVAHFAVAVALRKAGIRLGGDLLCESVVDEEWAGAGGTLAGRLRGDLADACVITEGTNLSVVRATRGGYFFDIICRAGDPSAYFSKQEVISPAVPMGRLLAWIDTWARKRRSLRRGTAYRDFPDPAPVQVLALEANRFDPQIPWSAPLAGQVRVYLQFLPHENVPAVIDQLKHSFARFCQQDPFFRVYRPIWRPIVDPPLIGHELPADHEWTRHLVRSAAASLGTAPPLTAAQYPCDAFIIQREYGVPTLLFGPSGAGAHNANEYVSVRSVLQTAEVLLTAALDWCGR